MMTRWLFTIMLFCVPALYGQVPAHVTAKTSQYYAYTGVALVSLPAVPNMGTAVKSGLIWQDPSLPASPPSYVIRCTDNNTDPNPTFAHQSKSGGMGGSGDAEYLFDANSSLLRVNLFGGQGRIVGFDGEVCSNDITADLNDTNPGSSSNGYNFGSGGTFDWTNAGAPAGTSIWYAFGTGTDAPSNGVAKYVINRTTHHFTVTTPYLDFDPGLPVNTTTAPAWQSGHAYLQGDYVSATLALADWNGASAYVLGDLILPLTNNPLNCAFKVDVVGTRGTQPNPWSALTDGTCRGAQTKLEGGATERFRNIGNSGIFTFQLTSAGGTSGVSTPTWATIPTGAVTVHPDVLSTVSDNGLTWTNSGTMVGPGWQSFSGISKDSNRFCSAWSSNFYGHASYGSGQHYTLDNGDQGTGLYVACYDFALNSFVVLNTATGIQSKTTCTGGTGYACTGGTLVLRGQGSAYPAITSNCSYELHNAKGGSTLDFIVVGKQQGLIGTCPGTTNDQNMLSWKPFAAFSTSTGLRWINTRSNHWTLGKQQFVNLFNAYVFGRTVGAYTERFDMDNPTTGTTSWQVGSPYTLPCLTPWTSGSAAPPCDGSAFDSHLAWYHAPGNDDSGPVCGSVFNAQTVDPNPAAAWMGEEVCVSANPTWDPTVGPPNGPVWRFAHTFNVGTNTFFDVQFAVSQLSEDGKYLAFSSDWMCTLGDTSGNSTNVCGPLWVAGRTYSIGQFVNPFSSTSGSGSNFGVWQVTVGGTAAGTAPIWTTGAANNCTAGTVVTDANGVQYTCVGPSTGKGEVFIAVMR